MGLVDMAGGAINWWNGATTTCACLGPQNGEPLCPCKMRAARQSVLSTPQPLPAYTIPQVPNIRFIFPTDVQAERATAAAKRNQSRPGYKGRVW